jgi:hypothetical protein
MPDVREVYEMVTKQKPPEPGALERQQRRQVRAARNKRLGAFAIAAVIGAVAIVLILVNAPGGERAVPADEAPTAPTAYPIEPQAEEIATGFVEAFGAFDGERAITYLADSPYLDIDANTPEAVPVFTSFLEAMGYEQILADRPPCRVTGSSASGTTVRCRFDWHAIRSREIGMGPYPGSWALTVRDGAIVRASLHWNFQEEFSRQMWEPFAEWVRTTYPKDFAVMYVEGGGNFDWYSDESSRLWEERTKEYVKEVQRGNV